MNGSINIPSNKTQRFWITVHVPEDAKAGKYQAKILITNPNNITRSQRVIPVDLEVFPIELKQHQGMHFFVYLAPKNLPAYFQNEKGYKKILRDLNAHGMTSVTCYSRPLMRTGVTDDQNWKIDNKTPKRRIFNLRDQIKWAYDVGLPRSGAALLWLDGSSSYGSFRVTAWRRIRQQVKDMSIFLPELNIDLLHYVADEITESKDKANPKNFKLSDFAKDRDDYNKNTSVTSPEVRLVISGLSFKDSYKPFAKYTDIYISTVTVHDRIHEDIKARRMNKVIQRVNHVKDVWAWEKSLAPVDAQTIRYFFGLRAWKSEQEGVALWSYFDGEALRPVTASISPRPTRDWKMTKKILRDTLT